MDLTHLNDQQLVDDYAYAKNYADELYAALEPYKAEIMRRHRESGELSFGGTNADITLKREPYSMAWLKRQYGYTEEDLPPTCFVEKITKAVDWEKAQEVLGKFEPSFTPSLKLKRAKE